MTQEKQGKETAKLSYKNRIKNSANFNPPMVSFGVIIETVRASDMHNYRVLHKYQNWNFRLCPTSGT